MEFNFGLGAVAVASSPGIVPEMETTDQPNGEFDLLESRTIASFCGATIHCTDKKGAAVVLLQEVLIRKGKTVKVRRELRQMFPMYECYIAAGSHVDVGNDENDRTLVEEYACNKAQITVVTFLHKQVFQTNALARTWYKPCDMSALEHMAQGCVLWLEAKTHDNVHRRRPCIPRELNLGLSGWRGTRVV